MSVVSDSEPLGRRPSPESTFSLRAGVRLEPLGDGSAVLYSSGQNKSVSLNPTAALVCAYADGAHSFSRLLGEVQELFPGSKVEEGPIVDCLVELVGEGFLEWT